MPGIGWNPKSVPPRPYAPLLVATGLISIPDRWYTSNAPSLGDSSVTPLNKTYFSANLLPLIPNFVISVTSAEDTNFTQLVLAFSHTSCS